VNGDQEQGRARRIGFACVGYAFGITMLGTTLPTPLYPLYQREFGFTSLLTTVIYAVYGGGVLAVLLLFGRASDVLGRRRVLLVGLAASAVSAVVFATDAGLSALFVGRVLSGISAGLFTGTATAALVELAAARWRSRAVLVATAVNMLGLGCGPLLAGLLAEYAPAPARLPYLVNLALLAVAALGIRLAPETAPASSESWLRPRWPSVPREARAVFLPSAVAVFAAFAVFGLLTAIEPGFLVTLLDQPSRAVAGAVVFGMFAGSAVGQVVLSRLPVPIALPGGCVVLVIGLAATGSALIVTSLPLLVVGTVAVGLGQGVSFRAATDAVALHSPERRRAETMSSLFVVAYVGISVPVVLVGVAASIWGLRTAGIAFTSVVAVITLGALLTIVRLTRSQPRAAGISGSPG
jgi:MFS family permease